jgi:hypothetical protein
VDPLDECRRLGIASARRLDGAQPGGSEGLRIPCPETGRLEGTVAFHVRLRVLFDRYLRLDAVRRLVTCSHRAAACYDDGLHGGTPMLDDLTFDDESGEDMYVFSGSDLLASHYDLADLDWPEVAARTAIDERRGLVITQAVVIEDVTDEFILYLEDPPDSMQYRRESLGSWTAGRRRQQLEMLRRGAGLLDSQAAQLLERCRAVGERRNTLAHGTIEPRLVNVAKPDQVVVPIAEFRDASLAIEWILTDRRTGATERVSMARLRQDLVDAQVLVDEMLNYAEYFVERARRPNHFQGGAFLGAPTP